MHAAWQCLLGLGEEMCLLFSGSLSQKRGGGRGARPAAAVGRPPTAWTQHQELTCLCGLQITVTTHTDGSAGYEVYVDGMLAAALPGSGSNAVNATLANPQLLLDGGHPIFLQVPAQAGTYVSPSRHFVKQSAMVCAIKSLFA